MNYIIYQLFILVSVFIPIVSLAQLIHLLSSPGNLTSSIGPVSNLTNTDIGSISLPPELFKNISTEMELGLVFTMFESSALFPISNISRLFPEANNTDSFAVASSVIGTTVAGHSVTNLTENSTVQMGIRLENSVSWQHAIARIQKYKCPHMYLINTIIQPNYTKLFFLFRATKYWLAFSGTPVLQVLKILH